MIFIRKAVLEDADLIVSLGKETFYQKWRPVNTEEDIQAYLTKAFVPEVIRADLLNTDTIFLLAYYQDTLCAYVKMRCDRTYPDFANEKALEIERIYVLQEFQRKKIGTLLMDECIAIAQEGKYKWLWLGVNIDNHEAIDFYKKYNFSIFGTKQFKLGDAVDDDYLMKLKLV